MLERRSPQRRIDRMVNRRFTRSVLTDMFTGLAWTPAAIPGGTSAIGNFREKQLTWRLPGI
ncbi:protein of unknown function [Candidatus Nitrosacidococcus tergens]|uniref:Uncharacterized protein n=1 Tax=Candidatus Nitrosacidococcus tergens TaxID=553981 RepID=A0A7G1Q9X7_9GAMM|nr:protein of unknown function [Candidatus Nitrosacidococcus tergens]